MGTATIDTPVGLLIVKSNDRAIVRVSWADQRNAVMPADTDPVCEQAIKELSAYFEGKLTKFNVPVRLSGSDLQLRVWQVMRDIPFGDVMTYGDVARKVGSEPQAVGTACIESKAFLLDLESGQGRLL
jgi:methylated-DNA-[protein]-cysteine S-methyltransferase